MMDDPRKYYKDTTMRLLGSFQLLEFALKVYVGLTYKIIKTRVEGVIHFDYAENDLTKCLQAVNTESRQLKGRAQNAE